MYDDQTVRIAAFLSQYIQPNYATRTLADREVQKQAIALLIEEKMMTRDEILKEAIRDYNVFIPFDMFPVEVDNG